MGHPIMRSCVNRYGHVALQGEGGGAAGGGGADLDAGVAAAAAIDGDRPLEEEVGPGGRWAGPLGGGGAPS